MEENPPEILMIYTTKNGRTGGMVEPIKQGIVEAGGTVAMRRVDEVPVGRNGGRKGHHRRNTGAIRARGTCFCPKCQK